MSRIYFHAQDDEAEVRGSERAYAGSLCSNLFVMALGLSRFVTDDALARYRLLFPEAHYIRSISGDRHYVVSAIETALRVGEGFFTETLNTALVMGSDPVKLLTRLHGQCEIHTYVEGPDRAWLADLIESGREDKVLRADMGWESVVTLLRSSDAGPVVTSYSVCDHFPNSHVANWTDENGGEDFYGLPREEQWSRAMVGLRAQEGLRLDPATWAEFWYGGEPATAFDLLERMRETAPV